MRAWIEEYDEHHDVHVHAVDKSQLDTLAEHCKALHNAGHVQTRDGDKHVMSADPFTIMAWCNARGVTYAQFMRDPKLAARFIEDPDNAAFRVWKGKL